MSFYWAFIPNVASLAGLLSGLLSNKAHEPLEELDSYQLGFSWGGATCLFSTLDESVD